LPETDILRFLQKININENLRIKDEILVSIQKHFVSDIRSMINYMQTNQNSVNNIIYSNIWNELHVSSSPISKIDEISIHYNMDKRHILKEYLYHIIMNNIDNYNLKTLNEIEFAIHIQDIDIDYIINYIFNIN
jgi:replication factor C subunit 3/5